MINFLVFQACWFACVLGATWGRPWTGPVLVGLALCHHLWRCARPAREVMLVLSVAVLGAVLDGILIGGGWLTFTDGVARDYVTPPWMIALWAIFATTLNASLAWLRRSYWMAALCGAVAGPLTYLAGERLGALTLSSGTGALPIIALGWTAMLPLTLWLAHRLDGTRPPQARGGSIA